MRRTEQIEGIRGIHNADLHIPEGEFLLQEWQTKERNYE